MLRKMMYISSSQLHSRPREHMCTSITCLRPKIHPVSKQTTNQTRQRGKSHLKLFISCAVAEMRSHIYHLYRTLEFILKWHLKKKKAGKTSWSLFYFYKAVLSPQCRSINYYLPQGFNGQCCCCCQSPLWKMPVSHSYASHGEQIS